MEEIVVAVSDYGFPVIACIGLGYFITIMAFINEHIEPEIEEMYKAQ